MIAEIRRMKERIEEMMLDVAADDDPSAEDPEDDEIRYLGIGA